MSYVMPYNQAGGKTARRDAAAASKSCWPTYWGSTRRSTSLWSQEVAVAIPIRPVCAWAITGSSLLSTIALRP